jgi:predicted ATP-grasp superfamily ATP-dependent carboligase
MDKHTIMILSGYNMRAVIAFLRVCKKNNVPFLVIADSDIDPILLTEYKENVAYIRKNKNIYELYEILRRVMRENDLVSAHIIPTTEYLNRYLINNQKIFEQENIFIPLVEKKLYEQISNKMSFIQMCEDYSINAPKLYQDMSTIQYPFIFKAKSYDTYRGKPIKIDNKFELDIFMQKRNIVEWFAQEYIVGSSYYLLFYFKKDGTYISFSQQNLVQQTKGGSIVAAKCSDIHNNSICKKYADMFREVKFKGLVMVEIRESKGSYYMIEANPRLWGPSQLFVDAKVPLFEYYLEDMGYDVDIKENVVVDKAWYFWNEGLAMSEGDESYYNYDKKELINDYEKLLTIEIYNRPDTKKLFCEKRIKYDFR